ncbi:DNA polymerase I [bacterium]|jgi:DNA polymerase-1|nr:DNA polymerase I [bacterium]
MALDPSKYPPSNTLYLVDISSFIFRAFYAIRTLSNRKGEPTNAVYGVLQMLTKLVDDANPQYLAIVYDSKEPGVRKQLYADYKANRSAPPDDLLPQFARIDELVSSLEMPSCRLSGMEADDLIATLTRKWLAESAEHQVVIVSGDKDLMQLVNGRVKVWDTMNGKFYGTPEVVEKFGVNPAQVLDYLSLVGDSSDNIPGVPSIGPKTATDLLKEHGTLEAILDAAKQEKISGKKGEVLRKHVQDAELSKKLATLHSDLKVDLDRSKLKFKMAVSEKAIDLFKELDFHTMVKKYTAQEFPGMELSSAPPSTAEVAAVKMKTPTGLKFETIATEKDLDAVIAKILKRGECGFDTETDSLNPRVAKLVGIALSCDLESGYYIPLEHREGRQLPKKIVLEKLRPILENPKIKKIGQNLKFDYSIMSAQGVVMDGIGADTMVAAYIIQPESRHNLQALSRQYLDYEVMTYEEVCGKGKDEITFDQIPIEKATRYSAEDAWVALKLWHTQQPLLEKERLMEVFAEVDLPLVPVLARMEMQGVAIDEPYLKGLSQEFETDLKKIEERIGAYTSKPINLNSTKQLAQLLFEELKLPVQSKTKTGYSTDASVLEALSSLHEVPRLLLEYREITKLKGTYVDPLPTLRDPVTGKIHAGFHQTVAATGRLSSSDPNLQNIPIRSDRGKRIRQAFIASPGNILVAADYSQIELRLLAHMSGDPELVRSFQKDEDIHRRTASEIFSIAPEKVSDEQRGVAKAINFGLMYGKTPFGLSQELKIPRKEAQEIIDRYFTRYSGVKKFFDKQISDAKERGWTSTLNGRKRYFPDIHSKNHAVRQNAERMALNAPLQGTAADLIKQAMIHLDEQLTRKGFQARLIIQVHDELLIDCPKKEEEPVKALLIHTMENAMKLSVPLKVNASSGPTWNDL